MSFHDNKGCALGHIIRPPTGPELALTDENGNEFARLKIGATLAINAVAELLKEPQVWDHPEVIKLARGIVAQADWKGQE